jgi:hypothetical protein
MAPPRVRAPEPTPNHAQLLKCVRLSERFDSGRQQRCPLGEVAIVGNPYLGSIRRARKSRCRALKAPQFVDSEGGSAKAALSSMSVYGSRVVMQKGCPAGSIMTLH